MQKTVVFILSLILLSIISPHNGFTQDASQWYIPEGAIARFGKGKINGITYSPDGTCLVIASSIGVWNYNMHTGEELPLLAGYTGFVTSVAYSPDGSTLASADEDGTVRLWDVGTGERISILAGHTDKVTSVVYSPDGRTLASGSRDNTVRLWDTHTNQLKRTLTGHSHWVDAVAYSPDGMRVASASEDSTVRLWDINTGETVATLTKHTGHVTSVVYSPDGMRLASSSDDGTVRLWDANTGQQIRTLTGHSRWVVSVAYSPDSMQVASGSDDGTVRLWNANTGTLITTLTGHTNPVSSVAYSPDGMYLASGSGDGTVRVWNTNTGEPITSLTGYIDSVTSIAYSADGSIIAGGIVDGTVRLWDVDTKQPFMTLMGGHPARVAAVAFSPDGTILASVGGYGDSTIRLWDINTGKSLGVLDGQTSAVYALAYSPDGNTLATGGGFGDNTVHLWDTRTGEPIAILKGHRSWIHTVAFSSDGSTLASGSRDATVHLWDVNTGEPKAALIGHTDRIYTVAFSPDGSTLASGSRDDTVRLWDTNTGELKATLIGHAFGVRSVAYSPNGRMVVSGGEDNTVRLWDAATGYSIDTLTGHTDWVTSVAFSPDGTTLTTGSQDGTILFWDFILLHRQEEQLQQAVTRIQQQHQDRSKVQLIYFQPSDRTPQQGIDTQADHVIKDIQLFYARQMETHGFDIKTFILETDLTDKAVVHHVKGQFPEAYYHDQPYNKILEEIDTRFDRLQNILLIFLEAGEDNILGNNICGLGGAHLAGGGAAILPAAGDCFSFRIVAHELGHAFGLPHDFNEPNLMADSSRYVAQLSTCAAEALNVHPFFNAPRSDLGPATIQRHPPLKSASNTVRLQYEVTDPDGLYQAQLLTPSTPEDPIQGAKMIDCQQLNGERSTIEFIVSDTITAPETFIGLQVLDIHGNITLQWHRNEADRAARLDVNDDGVVNILDLVLVASRLGQTGTPNPADVNGDGVVNVQDLVLVANGFGDVAAAPSARELTAVHVDQWLKLARQEISPLIQTSVPHRDFSYARGIQVLEQLRQSLIPKTTTLLPNYPNPFNPETWIPYHLANPSAVQITIYDARGTVVRQLDLGHQREGYYTSRSRAAYWDGTNEIGESVASGVYFYQLQADNTSTLRKMLILK